MTRARFRRCKLGETILVTVHPDHLAPAVLAPIDMVFAIGPSPEETLKRFAGAGAQHFAWPEGVVYVPGSLVAWFVGVDQLPFSMQAQPARAERIRHHRKYAEGDLRWHSFYFRGPDDRHNFEGPEPRDLRPDRRGHQ